jgi:hypothetical protein
MIKKLLNTGLMGFLLSALFASPALAEHNHAFEGGFKDELGRIGAHAAVNLGANLLGGILNGSGLSHGAGGAYGGPGLINRTPAHYRQPVEHHHHHYRDRVIERKVYVYQEYYPERHYYQKSHWKRDRHHHGNKHYRKGYYYEEDDCDDDD